jgi:3-hydroxyisobutyrate dehydrogenase-like beta-hydroxyacid dehydrogenase
VDREHPRSGDVAVIGLGAMGGPIATHLARAGLRPWVVDLDADRVADCVRAGARATDLAGAARADVVLLMVPSDRDVRALCLDHRFAGLLMAGAVLCIASSVQPETCSTVAAQAPQAAVLDTALTGGVRGAEAGMINLLVGGDLGALDRTRWALEPWTATIHHLGPLGAGQIAKTCNNMLHWAQITAIAESLDLARRYGLSVPRLRAALLDSPVASRTLAELEHMRLTWHAKDLANALAAGDAVGRELPVAHASQELMRDITVEYLQELLGHESGT